MIKVKRCTYIVTWEHYSQGIFLHRALHIVWVHVLNVVFVPLWPNCDHYFLTDTANIHEYVSVADTEVVKAVQSLDEYIVRTTCSFNSTYMRCVRDMLCPHEKRLSTVLWDKTWGANKQHVVMYQRISHVLEKKKKNISETSQHMLSWFSLISHTLSKIKSVHNDVITSLQSVIPCEK